MGDKQPSAETIQAIVEAVAELIGVLTDQVGDDLFSAALAEPARQLETLLNPGKHGLEEPARRRHLLAGWPMPVLSKLRGLRDTHARLLVVMGWEALARGNLPRCIKVDRDETNALALLSEYQAALNVLTRYLPKPAERPRAEPAARHSPDFHSVFWHGMQYTFTSTQAACVKVLWEAWEQGTPDVGQAAILEAVDSDRCRLSDVFGRGKKRHPAWGTMIRSGATKGTYRLAEPEI